MPVVETADLEMTYEQHGDGSAPAVLLLHGWPDDASTWDKVAPAIAAAGYRAIVPTLRGFGDTRFLSDAAPRTGNSGSRAEFTQTITNVNRCRGPK